jgi:ATP-dependent helicase/nuclease subunit B
MSNKTELFFNGKIDRIDTVKTNGQTAAVIFDYKRSEKSFSWSKFYNGLDIQLPIYILAAQNASKSQYPKVIGAFYMPIEANPKKADFADIQKRAGKFARKAKGIFDGHFASYFDTAENAGENPFYNFFLKDGQPYGNYSKRGALKPNDFEMVMRFAEKKIVELAQAIVSGKIDVKPYRLSRESPCKYCDYKSLCRFDPLINNYNAIEQVSKTQLLEKLESAND